MNRQELLTNIHTSRARLDASSALVDESHTNDIALYNAWSVTDLLAHIGWWEQRAASIVSSVLRGQEPAGAIDSGSTDTINARIYQEYHGRPLAEIRAFERGAYTALLSLVENATDDQLFNTEFFQWTKGQPLANWIIWNTYEHYDEHLQELRSWIERKN